MSQMDNVNKVAFHISYTVPHTITKYIEYEYEWKISLNFLACWKLCNVTTCALLLLFSMYSVVWADDPQQQKNQKYIIFI